jgi:lysophospholipase L1-like esterase
VTTSAVAGRILLGALLLVAFGEIAARSLGLLDRLGVHPLGLYVGTDRPDLPYRLRPRFRADPPQVRHPVRVNALGLRGPEIDPLPRPGWRRVLVLGDSVVHGHALREEDAFPSRLGLELGTRGVERVEVLNAGTSGWDTVAEAAFLEEFGLALAPSLVVLGVSLNDYVEPPELTRLGALAERRSRTGWTASLAERSHLFAALRHVAERLRRSGEATKPVARPAASGRSSPDVERRADAAVVPPAATRRGSRHGAGALDEAIARRHARFYRAPSEPAWTRTRDALARIRDLTSEHGVALEVVLFPESFQFDRNDPDRRPQRAWLSLCRELGLRCFDLWTAFATAEREPARELFGDVQHPNAAGHAIAAQAVAERLAASWSGAAAASGARAAAATAVRAAP